jgi:hypothetical protein
VRAQIETIVTGLRTRRPPTAGALEQTRAVGRRRAAAQLALPDVVEAYHIAYREIWNELLAGARRHDPDLTPELAGEVAPVWLWFHRLAGAVADAHATESRTRAATRLTLRRQFLQALTEGAREAGLLTSALGFGPDGEFVAVCASPLGDLAPCPAAPPGRPAGAGRRAAARYPRLPETVRAYAGSGYSISACARLLHIHPNTAKYRLDRWKALTGWDVQTFPGLAASLLCLGLSPGAASGPSPAPGTGSHH